MFIMISVCHIELFINDLRGCFKRKKKVIKPNLYEYVQFKTSALIVFHSNVLLILSQFIAAAKAQLIGHKA